jgi:hypothetical protein
MLSCERSYAECCIWAFVNTSSPTFVNTVRSLAKTPIVGLSEITELARLEPLQYQLEGAWVNTSTTGEGMLYRVDREQHQGDPPANHTTISMCAQMFSRP